jgi:hypothetical protein
LGEFARQKITHCINEEQIGTHNAGVEKYVAEARDSKLTKFVIGADGKYYQYINYVIFPMVVTDRNFFPGTTFENAIGMNIIRRHVGLMPRTHITGRKSCFEAIQALKRNFSIFTSDDKDVIIEKYRHFSMNPDEDIEDYINRFLLTIQDVNSVAQDAKKHPESEQYMDLTTFASQRKQFANGLPTETFGVLKEDLRSDQRFKNLTDIFDRVRKVVEDTKWKPSTSSNDGTTPTSHQHLLTDIKTRHVTFAITQDMLRDFVLLLTFKTKIIRTCYHNKTNLPPFFNLRRCNTHNIFNSTHNNQVAQANQCQQLIR